VAHPELKPRQGTSYAYPFCHLFPSYHPRLLSEPLPPALFPNGQGCKLPPRVSAELGRKRISMHFEVTTTTNLTHFKDTELPKIAARQDSLIFSLVHEFIHEYITLPSMTVIKFGCDTVDSLQPLRAGASIALWHAQPVPVVLYIFGSPSPHYHKPKVWGET